MPDSVVKQNDGTVQRANKDEGILSVNADGVPTYDESHDKFHSYNMSNSCSKSTNGCTLERARQGNPRYPVPFSNGKPVKDEDIGNAIIGQVRHEVFDNGGMVINVTIPFYRHLLNPGVVKRWVSEDANRVYINTYGEGTGNMGQINGALKHQVWDPVDRSMINWMTYQK